MTYFKKEGFDRGSRGGNSDRRGRSRSFEGSRGGFGERSRPFSDSGRFNRDSFDNRAPRARLEMHDAVCDRCGKACQLPFRPNGSKPVFCRDCFGKNDGPESRPAQSEMSTAQFDQIIKKLDQIMKVLKIN